MRESVIMRPLAVCLHENMSEHDYYKSFRSCAPTPWRNALHGESCLELVLKYWEDFKTLRTPALKGTWSSHSGKMVLKWHNSLCPVSTYAFGLNHLFAGILLRLSPTLLRFPFPYPLIGLSIITAARRPNLTVAESSITWVQCYR